MKILQSFCQLCLLLHLSVFSFAQTKEDKKSEKEDSHISDIITKDALSDDGLFSTHQLDGKLYFEIPDTLLDEDILLVTRIVKIPSNLSPYINAGSKTGQQVVTWQKMGN